MYIAGFGAVFGAVYPLRALVMSERFSAPYFGRIIGLQALFVAAAPALGPVTICRTDTSQSGYKIGFRLVAVMLLVMALVSLDAAVDRDAKESRRRGSPFSP
ncbi:MAG: hypothetical protein IT580_12525 [Verrucomicrobiales bacterium]|nr:hypothetical protein [Verrucomicrobiales bacterium]